MRSSRNHFYHEIYFYTENAILLGNTISFSNFSRKSVDETTAITPKT